MNQSQQYETPRRTRHTDDLHTNMSAQRNPLSPRDYGASGPRIALEQATPDTSQYQNGPPLPGALQPGRSGPVSTNTAPSLPTISQDQYSTPSRRFDSQGFATFQATTPGASEQEPILLPNAKIHTSKFTKNHIQHSPRTGRHPGPRTESALPEGLPGANPYSYDGTSATPTNSNYLAPWALYAFDWCKWPAQNNDAGKVAIGSYLEDGHNFIQILDSQIVPTPSESYVPGGSKYGLEFTKIAEATHSYPVTRLLWEPPSSQKQSTDLLATSDSRAYCPFDLFGLEHGLTEFDHYLKHRYDMHDMGYSTLTAKTQLIAHDKEVFDVRFCANSVDVFVSCGADGSVRMFDLRSLEHSTIIYEPTSKDDKDTSPGGGRISPTLAQQTMSYAPPLLRLAASPHDTHLLATFSQDSNIIRILDVRQPGQALLELRGHSSAINCIEWSPSRRGTLASGADDSLVLIWDLLNQSTTLPTGPGMNGAPTSDNSRGPTASWQCDYEVGNISWAPCSNLNNNENGDWLGVSGGKRSFFDVSLSPSYTCNAFPGFSWPISKNAAAAHSTLAGSLIQGRA
ncbi:hypothetical protein DID88_004046 [Monilinia fructigena]|uniref:Anaphase-promoting complex subunit 4 WD40 domain-containing protein n=1 Tax=Monilinia fructigena TaxID=38457 RepID=A0A395IRL8_9HELO|nr:hypothetical protein DID88_004046 [Monilinia fructigena]